MAIGRTNLEAQQGIPLVPIWFILVAINHFPVWLHGRQSHVDMVVPFGFTCFWVLSIREIPDFYATDSSLCQTHQQNRLIAI